jgi:cell division cycle 14
MLADDLHEDRENWVESGTVVPQKTPSSNKSGSGTLAMAKVRASPRRATDNSKGGESTKNGIRKMSGRVGSVGTSSPTRVK